MQIDQLAAWGEFVGGIAVVAGLFFVAVQLRSSNRESRLAANEAYSQSITNIGMLLATQADLADIFMRGSQGLENLNGAERLRFMTFYSNGLFRTYENLYTQHQTGRLDRRIWEGAEMTLRVAGGSKGFQDVWAIRKTWYAREFQDYIDLIVKEKRYEGALSRSYSASDP